MTAKEKAKELFVKYGIWCNYLSPTNRGYVTNHLLHTNNSKQSALACIEEIKSTMISRHIDYKEQVDEVDWVMCYSYWVDVAIELNSL